MTLIMIKEVLTTTITEKTMMTAMADMTDPSVTTMATVTTDEPMTTLIIADYIDNTPTIQVSRECQALVMIASIALGAVAMAVLRLNVA